MASSKVSRISGEVKASNQRAKKGLCPLCARQCRLTFHHLIPRKMHRRTYFRKHFSRQELQSGIDICRQCHSGIHKQYDEMTLAKRLNTLEKLQEDPVMQRHCHWVGRQKIRL